MSFQGAHRPRASVALARDVVTLDVCQQPHQALVTSEHKEKTRKAIDPPPVIKLSVHEGRAHEQRRNWMVSPFIFMNVVLVEVDQDPRGGPHKTVAGNNLLGQTVSSLHRLKDMQNIEGGFFVFGDVSCRQVGRYRLQFNLFDFENGEAVFVSSQVSDPFHVVSPKEFHGQKESTALSRSFSEQGVRLRLRKEHRAVANSKRGYDASPEQSSAVSYSINNNIQSDRFDFNPSKRPRPNHGYNPAQMYFGSQAPGNPLFQYGTGLQGGNYGMAGHVPHSSAVDQNTPFSTMSAQGFPLSSSTPGWQRAIQPAPLSTSMGGLASGAYLNAPPQRNETSPNQPLRPGQPTPLRTPDESMSVLSGLHTPSSLPDSAHTSSSQQQQNYIDAHGHSGSFSTGPPAYSIQNPHDTPDPQSQLDYRSSLPNQYLPQYQSSMRPLSSSATYHHPSQGRSISRYDPGQFAPPSGAVQHPFSDPERSSYPPHPSHLSDNSTTLDSGILNRGFIPPFASQGAQSGMESQHHPHAGAGNYKDPPYLTPHQTSPM